MAARKNGIWNAALAGIFTTVIAPVLVTVTTHALQVSGPRANQVRKEPPARAARVPERDIVIGHGLGTTPEAAYHDALRNALLHVLEQSVPAADLSMDARLALCQTVLQDADRVITRHDGLGCRPEMGAGVIRYRAEVMTEIERGALRELLRVGPSKEARWF